MFRNKNIYDYKRVLFIDADVYVTRHAKNPFDGIGDEIIWSMAKIILTIFPITQKQILSYTHIAQKNNRPDYMLNAGVFIIKKHTVRLWKIFFMNTKNSRAMTMGHFLIIF